MTTTRIIGPDDPDDPDWTPASSPEETAAAARAGRTVVVTLTGDETTQLAVAAVHAWAGARVFRTDHPDSVRQAVTMAESLAGRRPPALARRGLA